MTIYIGQVVQSHTWRAFSTVQLRPSILCSNWFPKKRRVHAVFGTFHSCCPNERSPRHWRLRSLADLPQIKNGSVFSRHAARPKNVLGMTDHRCLWCVLRQSSYSDCSMFELPRNIHNACQVFPPVRRIDTCTAQPQTQSQVRGLKTDRTSPSYINPFLELQKFVSVPILSEQQAVFSPSDAEIKEAVSIFSKPKGKTRQAASFVGTFVDGSEVPDLNFPQVCFLGRSNVGKSSLISSMLRSHPHVTVSVSKQPGHTKKLHIYSIGQHFALVDMPGYGYNMPRTFYKSVETFLNSSRRLSRTFLLVDGEVGLTSTDHTALDMLHEFGISYVVVLTKIDKVGRHKLLRNVMEVMKVCEDKAGHACFSQPFLVSSRTGDGMKLLQTFIAYVTGSVHIKGL